MRFETHLAQGCVECGHALAEYREALVGPAADLREVPPPRVKRALVERLARSHARRPRPARLWPGLKWVASVAVAAGLIASVVATYVSARYEQRLGEIARETAALREQISQQRQALALLRDPATRIITLAGLEPSPKAQGRMFWNERDGGIFVAADLPPAAPGKAYELWAIVGGKPIPAGLFGVDAEGKGNARVAPLRELAEAESMRGLTVDQFAVTLEPAGGVRAPTLPMYLVSK